MLTMNESDKLKLEKRLSQLHEIQQHAEKQQKDNSMEDDLGMETGYVTDSSINSRKGTQPNIEIFVDDKPLVNRRKTKSERNKRRSSRVSLLEAKDDSGSENSTDSMEDKQQPRYRKRAGSKRVENIENNGNSINNNNNKENVDVRRRRAGSKTVALHEQQQQQQEQETTDPKPRITFAVPTNTSITIAEDVERDDTLDELSEKKLNHGASTTTLKMNSKDIYFGTWNPKERAVLDQVLVNIDLKPDGKKSFINKFKWPSASSKDKSSKKEQYQKIEEDEEEIIEKEKSSKFPISSPKYPLNRYVDDSEKNKKTKFGLLKRFKGVLKKNDDDMFTEEQMQHYGVSVRHKKKGLFSRLSSSKRKDFDSSPPGRRRAHSSNDYARSVGVHEQSQPSPPVENKHTNLSKKKSESIHSIRNLFASSRAKSVDNLHGAFEYFANEKQVFQRTPSMTKLDSKSSSMERLDNTKRSASQKLLNHGFEPVKPSARELCYEDHLVYAHAKMIKPHTANQRNIHHLPRQVSSDGYCSAYEDDYYRGYQSDRSPSIASAGLYQQHFNFDMSYSDTESFRPHSSMSAHPNYYTPLPPQRMAYGPPPHPPPNQYYIHNHAPPMPGYYTPGYATPGRYTPNGYATPGMQSGYASESEYTHYAPRPRHHPSPPVPISMISQHAKRAIQRSVSKTSSNYSSNYGYMSESSFCEEEEMYSMVHPPSLGQNYEQQQKQKNSSRSSSRVSQLSSDV